MESTTSVSYWGRRIAALGVFIAVVVALAIWLSSGGWPFGASSPSPSPTVADTVPGGSPEPSPTQSPQPTPEPEPEPTFEPSTFTLVAAGDVLPHGPVHVSAQVSGGYDFTPLLAGIDDLIASSVLAICHMEVPVIADGQKPSGYPMFGASPQIINDLQEQGWDGCSTASNHSVDRAFDGVVRTIDRFDELDMGFVGTARTKEEATPQFFTVTHGDYETVVAQLSYTYGLNGLPMPEGKPFAVNLIDSEKIIAEATEARKIADLVVVSVHAGNEYQSTPNEQQFTLTQELADSAEIDLYIGHHAHVPQPIVKLKGGPRGEGMWTAYGLGNMISNQSSVCCVASTSNGLMMFAQFERDNDEPARVSSVSWRALTVDRAAGHRLYDLTEVASLKSAYGQLSAAEIAARYDRVVSAVGDEAPEASELPDDSLATLTVHKRTDTVFSD